MNKPLRILIASGPTIEPIDPIRFISNRSTGVMGNELAKLAKKRKHKVTLISGPTNLKPPKAVKCFYIETAHQLYTKVHQELKNADVLIMASAVSDFRVKKFSKNKIKSPKPVALTLVKNPDILKAISQKERKNTNGK